MSLWQYLPNLYVSGANCEKPFWLISESLAAVSSLSFFLVAYFIHQLLKRDKITSAKLDKMPLFIILVGIGSFASHGFNNLYTFLIDLFFAYGLVLYSAYLLLGKLTRNKITYWLLPASFILTQFIAFLIVPISFFDMPLHHIVNLLFGMVLFFWTIKKLGKEILPLLFAMFIYGIGIFLRSVDIFVCQFFRFGTHFLWHITGAIAIYFVAKFLFYWNQKTNRKS